MASRIPLTSPVNPAGESDMTWSFAAGAIVVMFIIFTAQKGSLPNWLQLLFYTPSTGAPTSNPTEATKTNAPVIGINDKGQATYYQNPGSTAERDLGFFGNIWNGIKKGGNTFFNGVLGISPAQ
jgi:hypothetical protein